MNTGEAAHGIMIVRRRVSGCAGPRRDGADVVDRDALRIAVGVLDALRNAAIVVAVTRRIVVAIGYRGDGAVAVVGDGFVQSLKAIDLGWHGITVQRQPEFAEPVAVEPLNGAEHP